MLLLGYTGSLFANQAARPPFNGFCKGSPSAVISLFKRNLLGVVTKLEVVNEVFEYDTAPKTAYLLELMSILNKQDQIEEVHFNLNGLKRRDWYFIANGLLYNQSLSKLSCHADQLGEAGLSTFLTALCYNTSIEQFTVTGSPSLRYIPGNRITELGEVVQSNKRLKLIDLSSFEIKPSTADWVLTSLTNDYLGLTTRPLEDLPTIKLNFQGKIIVINSETILDNSLDNILKELSSPKAKM